MQRDRHDSVSLGQKVGAGARHPAAHNGCKIEPVAIFKRMDQIFRYLVIAHSRPRPAISRRIGLRLHGQDIRTRVIDKGDAELFAEWPLDRRELRPAGGAEAMIRDRLAA